MLPNRPPVGLYRHQTSLLTVCVMDADYDLNTPAPVFLTSRGTLGNMTFVPQSATNLYCYTSPFNLEVGSDLEDVDIQLEPMKALYCFSEPFGWRTKHLR